MLLGCWPLSVQTEPRASNYHSTYLICSDSVQMLSYAERINYNFRIIYCVSIYFTYRTDDDEC
jgi:hypothetical protein